jgi:hypothetical protein
MLLLLTLPAVVQAQFNWSVSTETGTITITGYTGRGGAVVSFDDASSRTQAHGARSRFQRGSPTRNRQAR